jgi:hypothetical protein
MKPPSRPQHNGPSSDVSKGPGIAHPAISTKALPKIVSYTPEHWMKPPSRPQHNGPSSDVSKGPGIHCNWP